MHLTTLRLPLALAAATALTACGSSPANGNTGPGPYSGSGWTAYPDGGFAIGEAGAAYPDGGTPGTTGGGNNTGFPGGNNTGFPSGGGSNTGSGDGGVLGGGGSDAGGGGGGGGGDGGDTSGPLPTGMDYSGWTYVEVDGSTCRDGSKAGYYYRLGSSKNLMIFLNGGGACADSFFCGINPVNVNQDMPIEYLIEGTLNLVAGPNPNRQLPPDEGIFKKDPKNPVADWNMIFIPYCTGDIHAGVNTDVTIPNVNGPQQFTGYTNFGLFLDSFGAHFSSANQVLLTGSSAGGFGSLLNFDRTQEFFNQHGGAQVTAISDSGIPMPTKYMAACLQAKWRKYWGIDKIPVMQECGAPCQDPSGGNLTEGLGDYMFHQKYKGRMLGGAVSTVNDEIIRAFFAPGQNSAGPDQPDNCTVDPGSSTVFSATYLNETYTGQKYDDGLQATEALFGADQIGFYAMKGSSHMHLWRADYYVDNGTGTIMADWVTDILAGKNTKVGSF